VQFDCRDECGVQRPPVQSDDRRRDEACTVNRDRDGTGCGEGFRIDSGHVRCRIGNMDDRRIRTAIVCDDSTLIIVVDVHAESGCADRNGYEHLLLIDVDNRNGRGVPLGIAATG